MLNPVPGCLLSLIVSQNASKPSSQVLWLDGISIFKALNQLCDQLGIFSLGQSSTEILFEASIRRIAIALQQPVKQ